MSEQNRAETQAGAAAMVTSGAFKVEEPYQPRETCFQGAKITWSSFSHWMGSIGFQTNWPLAYHLLKTGFCMFLHFFCWIKTRPTGCLNVRWTHFWFSRNHASGTGDGHGEACFELGRCGNKDETHNWSLKHLFSILKTFWSISKHSVR